MSLFNTSEFTQITVDNVMAVNEYYWGMDIFQYSEVIFPIRAMYFKASYQIIDGYLFVVDKKMRLLGIPFDNDGNLIELDHLIKLMKKLNVQIINRIPSDCQFMLDNKSKLDELFVSEKKWFVGYEYIYDNIMLNNLYGKAYSDLRYKIHKFERNIDSFEIIPYDKSLYHESLRCYDAWCEVNGHKLVERYGRLWDKKYYPVCMANHSKLGLDAFLVRDKAIDKFVGCVAFAIVSDNIVYGLFRKLSSSYQYLAQYMQWYQARILNDYSIQYMNDGNDGNNKGLREFKTGFNPIRKNIIVSLLLK